MSVQQKLMILANEAPVKHHTLTWRKHRATCIVTAPGKTLRPAKAGEGEVIKSRRATPEEVKMIKNGKWLRIRSNGKMPGDAGARSSGLKGRPKLKKPKKT